LGCCSVFLDFLSSLNHADRLAIGLRVYLT
jgi:hypothetical protein